MTNEFFNYVKDEAKDRLNNYIGNSVYLCDLGMTLTEEENVDGTWSYSVYKDSKNIKKYWDDCGDFVEYYKDNFGEDCKWNPFSEPEKFFCSVMIEAISILVGQSICNNEEFRNFWNNEIKITEDVVNKIIEGFENIEEIF